MPSISIPGIGSGLDVASLVDQLVAAERQPVANRLNLQEVRTNAQLSAIGKLKSALAAFRDASEALKDTSGLRARSVSSSHEALVTATAAPGAPIGQIPVEVVSLASSHRLASGAFPSADAIVGTGTLDITVNGETMSLDVAPGSDSLGAIRNAINAAPDNPGVTATIVNAADGAHLVVSADSAGADNAINISSSGGALELLTYDAATGIGGLTEQSPASDAEILVDGFTVFSADNDISGAVEGLTFSLNGVEAGTVATITVTEDLEVAKEALNAFSEAHNELIGVVRELTAFDQGTGIAGELLGDPMVRDLKASLRRELSAVGPDEGSYRLLAEIGLDLTVEGRIDVDDVALDEALAGDFDAVADLFEGDAGLAGRVDAMLALFLDDEGRILTREETLKEQLDVIEDDRAALDRRLEDVRRRYQTQFAAMDQLVAQLQSTSSFLLQQLGA